MYRTTINFHDRIERGEKPIPFVLIETDMGTRGYSERQFSDTWGETNLADGSVTADGSETANPGLGFLEYTARLQSVSRPTRTISPKKLGLLIGYTQKQQATLRVKLANYDLYFSKLIAKEPFITKTLSVYVGFSDLPFSESLLVFKGNIENLSLDQKVMTLEVVETSLNTGVLFTLNRASRYTNPLNTNDRLPIVYGDLTDGTTGNYIIPCIDTVNFVYCFADHAVLSVANGNSVNVYANDVLVDPGQYVFDESNDYESEGIIATIDFTADQTNNVISIRGKGKNDGASLVENIIDILDDFMTVHNSYTSADFDTTKKAAASDIFLTKSYKAAGAIVDDEKLWNILQDMMASFLGSIYLNSQGLFALDIESEPAISNTAATVSQKDFNLMSVEQEKISLVNQIPASYAYNYNMIEFNSHTDDTTYADLVSQSIYGVSTTTNYWFRWCRDTTSVNVMQDIITSLYGRPKYQIIIEDLSLKRIHADVGDYLTVSIDEVFDDFGRAYINQFMKIVSVQPDLQKQTIVFRLVDTDSFLYVAYIADGTYLADGSITAGANRDLTEY